MFQNFVDDAALFPPGEAPMASAVAAHAGFRSSELHAFVGPFIVSATDLADLDAAAAADPATHALAVNVVAEGTSSAAAAVRFISTSSALTLAGIELKLDSGKFGPQVDRLAALTAAAGHGVQAFAEAPRPSNDQWHSLLKVADMAGVRIKLRTGGVTAEAFPTDAEVGRWIQDLVDQRIPFKCTAGLHNAVRHTGVTTGFEHHGYLNILAAVGRAVIGQGHRRVVDVISERSAVAVAAEIAAIDAATAHRMRSLFASYGSCSITEPFDDLVQLQLISNDPRLFGRHHEHRAR